MPVTRQLRHLRGGHRTDTVAAVVQHQPLVTGDTVTPEPQADLRGEWLEHGPVAHRRRRPEHQRPRAGDMPTSVRVRAADVADDEILGAELALEPFDVDDRRELRHGRGTLA